MPKKPKVVSVGQTFGRLTVIGAKELQLSTSKRRHNRTVVLCRCDCGKEKNIRVSCLTSKIKPTQSCGCNSKEAADRARRAIRKDPAEVAWKHRETMYKSNAIRRGLVWELSTPLFRELCKKDCLYCGQAPAASDYSKKRYIHTANVNRHNVDLAFAESKIIYINGIDRFDNTIGYTLLNSVTCCSACNRAKNDMNIEEWQAWLDRIVAHQTRR